MMYLSALVTSLTPVQHITRTGRAHRPPPHLLQPGRSCLRLRRADGMRRMCNGVVVHLQTECGTPAPLLCLSTLTDTPALRGGGEGHHAKACKRRANVQSPGAMPGVHATSGKLLSRFAGSVDATGWGIRGHDDGTPQR